MASSHYREIKFGGNLYFVKRREGINKCDVGESYFMESWDLEHHFASEVVLLIGGDGCSDELRFGVVRIVKPFVHPYQENIFALIVDPNIRLGGGQCTADEDRVGLREMTIRLGFGDLSNNPQSPTAWQQSHR